jgi:methylated-DNA-[protein]-cysteine S-methyltransferase
VCSAIPKGRVTTYGDLARALTPPSSARAVGQAMRRNPYAPKVPCHRVVASDLQLGGFTGEWGAQTACVQRKRVLLREEGVTFEGEERISPACVVRAAELRRLAEQRAGAKAVDRAAAAAAPAAGAKR